MLLTDHDFTMSPCPVGSVRAGGRAVEHIGVEMPGRQALRLLSETDHRRAAPEGFVHRVNEATTSACHEGSHHPRQNIEARQSLPARPVRAGSMGRFKPRDHFPDSREAATMGV